MNVKQIADAMGVPLISHPILPGRQWETQEYVGSPPTDDAALYWTRGGLAVATSGTGGRVVECVLHELCHACAGPDGLENEESLMALQWALIRQLPPDEYRVCRGCWSGYILEGGDIGRSDDFLDTHTWADFVASAKSAGLLDAQGTPILRVHPAWVR